MWKWHGKVSSLVLCRLCLPDSHFRVCFASCSFWTGRDLWQLLLSLHEIFGQALLLVASAVKELPHNPSYCLVLLLLKLGSSRGSSVRTYFSLIYILASFPGSSLSCKVFASQPLLSLHLLLAKLIAVCCHSWLSLQKTGCSLFVKLHLCWDICLACSLISQTLWSMQTREMSVFQVWLYKVVLYSREVALASRTGVCGCLSIEAGS